jgi:hypothetical protein
VKKPRTIVFHAFEVEILGPRGRTKAARRKIRKVLSTAVLRGIEKASRVAAQKKLPASFRVQIS